jgi:predicted ATPase/tetratricopeptide (TPR) repeat protein
MLLAVARRGPPRTNLPVERGAFVGRERALAAIGRALGGDAPPVLALVGPPGIGKTRLALRAAARELPRAGHEGGVWLVEAQGVDDGAGIVRLIGLTLGLLPDAAAPAEHERRRVAAALGDGGASLVVVDGIDDAPDAIAVLDTLAHECPGARFLVTLRAALPPDGVAASLTVPSLATSTRAAGRDGTRERAASRSRGLDERELSEAATLFVERIGEARGTATRPLLRADLEAIEGIAQLLDGVPQALELAAARCRVLTPAELLERLPRRVATLSPQRGTSALAGVVAWSLDLLTTAERAVLAQCAIFHGGFTLDAARAVVDLADVPQAPPLDEVIASLVDKALLKVRRRFDDDTVRFDHPAAVRDLIVLVRPASRAPRKAATLEGLPGAFGMRTVDDEAPVARLELHIPREALVRRHATWTLSRCGALKENADSHGGLVARRELEAEVDNLLAVVRRALADEEHGLVATTNALLALAALEPILATRGPHQLFARLLDRAIEPAVPAGVAPSLVAQSLELRARLLRATGRLADAREDLEGALALARRAADRVLEARALANLGTLAVDVGELDEARRRYDEALALLRAAGDRRIEGRCIGYYGLLHEEADDLDAAARDYAAAIAIHAACGDRRYEAIHQMQLARVRLARGDVDGARDLLRRALTMHRELQNRRQEVHGLVLLGDTGLASGFVADAAAAWERAVPLAREIGDASLRCLVHARLARAAPQLGADRQVHDEIVDAERGRLDDPQMLGVVAVLRGEPPPANGVHVRAAARVHRRLAPLSASA